MKFFSLINAHAKSLTSSKQKIIPRDSFSKLLDIEAMLHEAKKDIEDLKQKTETERLAALQEAKLEGEKQGLAKFSEQLLYFDREIKAIRHEMSKQIMPLALKAAKKIVAGQLSLSPDTIVDIVMQSLAPITENRHIILYVNREDKQHLEKAKDKLLKLLPQIESFSIQESKDITQGGCRIWTETGFLNVELENQWKALEKAFEKFSH